MDTVAYLLFKIVVLSGPLVDISSPSISTKDAD